MRASNSAAHVSTSPYTGTLGRFDEAAAAYGKALANDPRLGLAQRNLVEALVRADRADEAVDVGQRAGAAVVLIVERSLGRPFRAEEHLEAVLELEPEVVLLGTGRKQAFPAPRLLRAFFERGIGFEAMTTEAACRTFNVLVSEGRTAVAALIID